MSDLVFYFIANLIDPIVAVVGLLIGAINSTWWKRCAGAILASILMALLIGGIAPESHSPMSGIARGFSLFAWVAIGAAIRGWRQRRRERGAE